MCCRQGRAEGDEVNNKEDCAGDRGDKAVDSEAP